MKSAGEKRSDEPAVFMPERKRMKNGEIGNIKRRLEMAKLILKDLMVNEELDKKAMDRISGGYGNMFGNKQGGAGYNYGIMAGGAGYGAGTTAWGNTMGGTGGAGGLMNANGAQGGKGGMSLSFKSLNLFGGNASGGHGGAGGSYNTGGSGGASIGSNSGGTGAGGVGGYAIGGAGGSDNFGDSIYMPVIATM